MAKPCKIFGNVNETDRERTNERSDPGLFYVLYLYFSSNLSEYFPQTFKCQSIYHSIDLFMFFINLCYTRIKF